MLYARQTTWRREAPPRRGAPKRRQRGQRPAGPAETLETLVVKAQGTIVPAYGSGADLDAGNRSLAAPENEVAPMQ